LNGIPGSGKSILTSIIIQSLLEQQAEAHGQPPLLAYFCCSKKNADPRTADPKEILCSTLRQLTSRDARLALRGSVTQDFQRRKDEADQRGAQILPLDIEETVAHISAITEKDPITIVLDALDEVEEKERGDLFDALERVVQDSPNVVKIFVSSRNDGDIVERFEKYAKIGLRST
jgi:NACHT domain